MMESKPYTYSNGYTYWRLPDERLHREDGPAITSSAGTKYWFKYNNKHRLYGPAVIWSDGTGQWWINGYNIHRKINKWAKEMNIDLDNLSDEDKFMIRLYWENYSE